MEWLLDEFVVGVLFKFLLQAPFRIGLIEPRAQIDHLDPGHLVPHPGDNRKAIFNRHHDVRDDEVGTEFFKDRGCILPVVRDSDFVGMAFQEGPEENPDRIFVVYDKDSLDGVVLIHMAIEY